MHLDQLLETPSPSTCVANQQSTSTAAERDWRPQVHQPVSQTNKTPQQLQNVTGDPKSINLCRKPTKHLNSCRTWLEIPKSINLCRKPTKHLNSCRTWLETPSPSTCVANQQNTSTAAERNWRPQVHQPVSQTNKTPQQLQNVTGDPKSINLCRKPTKHLNSCRTWLETPKSINLCRKPTKHLNSCRT